jgi:phage terminase large subunit
VSRSERYYDPEAFAADVLGLHLYARQRELVRAVLEHQRVACRAGNAVGKTWAAAFLILFWLAGGPGSVVVSTSATEAQLRRVLWREVRRLLKMTGGYFAGAAVTETEIFMEPGWFATGFSTDTPEALQGVHADRVLVVVDEGSGVEEAIFDAIEGLLAGGDSRLLTIGNPLKTSGTFFDAFNSRRDEWHTLTISAYDTPAFTGEKVPREVRRRLVSKRFVQRLERRGVDSPEYRIRVLGEFPLRQDDAVVALADLEKAQAQRLESGLPLVIGVDPARFGSDQTAIAVREGNRVRVVEARRGFDLMQTTGRVVDLARHLHEVGGRKPLIVVDSIGVGAGVVDRLREIGEFQVRAFASSERASRSGDYPNRRSELWFRAAEVMPLLDLDPNDQELAADLLAPTYSFASDGGRVVEPKSNTRKRLRRSPDRADAVLLTLVVDPPTAPGRASKPRHGYWWDQGELPDATGRDPLAEGLLARGVPVHDGALALRASGLDVLERGYGAPHPDLAAGPDCPGSTVTKTPSIAERMKQGGFTWQGSRRQ